MRISPRRCSLSVAASSASASTARTTWSARWRSRSPAAVSDMPREVRSKSTTSSSVSSALICALTEGGVVKSRSAACVTLRNSATATNVRSWYSSMIDRVRLIRRKPSSKTHSVFADVTIIYAAYGRSGTALPGEARLRDRPVRPRGRSRSRRDDHHRGYANTGELRSPAHPRCHHHPAPDHERQHDGGPRRQPHGRRVLRRDRLQRFDQGRAQHAPTGISREGADRRDGMVAAGWLRGARSSRRHDRLRYLWLLRVIPSRPSSRIGGARGLLERTPARIPDHPARASDVP